MADLTTADVEAIKQFLLGTREDLLTWLPSGPWVPGWKSEAAAELCNVEIRADASPWGEDPIRTAYAAADMFIRATIDCLDAIADSTNLLTTIYVPHVLARAAMEAGSQAWWLLESGLGARRRVIRSILIRASSARYLDKAASALGSPGGGAAYGEDPSMVRAYASGLGVSYVCNKNGAHCESEVLPGYTARATTFEKDAYMTAAYSVYSGAAHAELYSVVQGWRPSVSAAPLWERHPDRVAVWAAVIAAAGFATIPTYRAVTLLGRNARKVDIAYSMRNLGKLMREMKLPADWVY